MLAYSTHFVFFDLLRTTGSVPLASLSHILSMIGFLLVVIAGASIVKEWWPVFLIGFANISFLILAVVVRTLVLVPLLAYFELDLQAQDFRVVGTTVSFILFFVMTALYVGAKAEHLIAVGLLTRAIQTLQHQLSEFKSQLDYTQRRLNSLVSKDLSLTLTSLRQQLAGGVKVIEAKKPLLQAGVVTMLGNIRTILSDNDRMHQRVATTTPVVFRDLRLKRPSKVPLRQLIAPVMPTVLLAILVFMLSNVLSGTQVALSAAGLALIGIVPVAIIATLIPKNFKVPPMVAGLLLLPLGALIALPLNIFASQITDLSDPAVSIFRVAIPVSGASLAVVGAAIFLEQQRKELIRQLLDVESEQVRSLELAKQQAWLSRRRWNLLLHGSLQSVLTALLSRLNQDKLDVKQLVADIDRAIEITANENKAPQDFRQAVAELKQTWNGVCEVNIDVSSSAYKALDTHQALSESLQEVLIETIGNAIRHSKSKTFTASIVTGIDSKLVMVAINDGEKLAETLSAGYGSETFEQLTSSYQLRQEGKTVVFEAELSY